jgi:hypothetical protein
MLSLASCNSSRSHNQKNLPASIKFYFLPWHLQLWWTSLWFNVGAKHSGSTSHYTCVIMVVPTILFHLTVNHSIRIV